MSRFNFGNRRNNGASDQERHDREVYFRQPQGYETHDRQQYQQDGPEYINPRLNTRGNERGDFRHYPNASEPQSDHYFRNGPQVPTRTSPTGRSDFPQLGGYTKAGPNPDELKGLSFWREEEQQQDDPENWNDRPSPFKFVIAISGLVALTAVAWFGYRWLSQSANEAPPLVQAESGPFKVRPENPGGIAIPHQDKLVYGRLAPSSGEDQPVERLLPPPDQHVVMPNQNPGYAYASGQQPPQQGYPIPPQQQASAYNQPYEQQQLPANQGSYPAPVPVYPNAQEYPQQSAGNMQPGQTYTQPQPIQQQGPQQRQPVYNSSYPAPAYPGQPVGQVPYQQQGQPYPTASGQPTVGQPYSTYGNQPVYVNPSQVPPQTNQPHPQGGVGGVPAATSIKPDVLLVEKEAEKTDVAAIPGQAFYIQLGTLPTEQSARQEVDRLSRKYKHDLIGCEPTVRMVEVAGGNRVYRVVSGPFKTRNAASTKSNKLGSGSRVVQLQN